MIDFSDTMRDAVLKHGVSKHHEPVERSVMSALHSNLKWRGKSLHKYTGIYSIRNMVDGKRYVGSAAGSFYGRWHVHRHQLRNNIHPNKHLQRAWNRDGEESFSFTILFVCAPADCILYEQRSIDTYRCANRRYGYNLSPTAGSTLGKGHTPEAREKMAAARRGKKASIETRAKMSASQRGKKRTKETCDRIGAIHRGKVISQETRKLIAAAARRRRHTPETKAKISAISAARVGWHHSPETIEKLRAAHIGLRHTEEAKRKMSLSHTGRKLTPEHIENARRGQIGKVIPLETRIKMSIAAKRRCERQAREREAAGV